MDKNGIKKKIVYNNDENNVRLRGVKNIVNFRHLPIIGQWEKDNGYTIFPIFQFFVYLAGSILIFHLSTTVSVINLPTRMSNRF